MYEIGTSLSNLETNLQEHASNQEVQGKRQELRSRLLSIIYLASETAGYPRKQQAELGIPDDFRSSYSNFVRNLVVLRKNGGTLQSFEEDLIKEGDNASLPSGLVELTKIVLLTFEVLISKKQ
mmetsp:Transcript_33106/g.104709  ORF Transcript_33106/g.104709 Transcript_33106/m.104709 type:complete len:123 (+) Transcript_33106:364-732(+)